MYKYIKPIFLSVSFSDHSLNSCTKIRVTVLEFSKIWQRGETSGRVSGGLTHGEIS